MKRFLITLLCVIVVGVIAVTGVYFADQKYTFLPESISDFLNENNMYDIDTSQYQYLSTMDEFVFSDHFDMKIPANFYVPLKEDIDKKYNIYADTCVVSMENVDILVQLYNLEVENDKDFLEKVRDEFIMTSMKNFPSITFNKAVTMDVNGHYIPIIWYSTQYKEQPTYTDVAFVECNGKLITITMNSAYEYMYTQELFASIIDTIEIT